MLHLLGAIILVVLLLKSPLTVLYGGVAWMLFGPVFGLIVGLVVLLADSNRY